MRTVLRLFVFLFAIFVVAAAYPEPSHKPSSTTSSKAPAPTGKCKYGPPLCCETVEPASDSVIGALLELLGITVSDLTTVCGTTCSAIETSGLGISECNYDPVCCEENNWGGLIAIGCNPYSI